MPFSAVNRFGAADYDPSMQRHHLLPCELMRRNAFVHLFDAIGSEQIGFDDFRSNGLLLPSRDASAMRLGLPLHRGPHRSYNAVVMERIGTIEAGWSRRRGRMPLEARDEAAMRIGLLQRALRRRLLDTRARGFALNRKDPRWAASDFTELDAMAEALWSATA